MRVPASHRRPNPKPATLRLLLIRKAVSYIHFDPFEDKLRPRPVKEGSRRLPAVV
jgi:hypothetical protein